MLHAKNLVKKFGEHTAVNGIHLEVQRGECFGLLGPNGAGKSTFIGMIYGAIRRSSGELLVFDRDPETDGRAVKRRLGVVTQDNALDESLSVLENMMLYSAFIGLPKSQRRRQVEELLEYMNLAHKTHALIQSLSGGMKRRLVFVRALLGKPELLILDEPTTGLDPAVRHLLWAKVKELRQNGTTILLTTHYMHEAEVLCDRLVIMNQGRVVAEGSPPQMIHEHTPGFVGIFDVADRARLSEVTSRHPDWLLTEDGSGLYLRAPSLAELGTLHSEHGLHPLQLRPSNLEDVFLKLTGKDLNSDA